MRRAAFGRVVVALLLGPASAAGQGVPEWTLAPPYFEVGGIDAEGEYALAELGGVAVLPNGNVLVGDRIEPFLKLFDREGRFLRTIGRFGKGPGEYEYVYQFHHCAPNEVWVRDVDRRVHRYSDEMEFITTDLVSFEPIGGGTGYRWSCDANGHHLVTGWGDIQGQFKAGLFTATAPVVLLHGDSLVHSFGERLSSERIGSVNSEGAPTGSGPHPFGRATVVALGPDHLYIGDGTDYEIEVYDLAGTRQPPIRWEGPSLENDESVVASQAEAAVLDAPERSRPALRRWYADLPELDQLPAYDRLLVSDSGELWARLFVRPGDSGEEWIVFGRNHRPIGRLELPRRSTLWEVRGGTVVYSTLDDFDVPLVRISDLVR